MELDDEGTARPLPEIVDPSQLQVCVEMDKAGWEIEDEFTEVPPYTHVISTAAPPPGTTHSLWLAQLEPDWPPLFPDGVPTDND